MCHLMGQYFCKIAIAFERAAGVSLCSARCQRWGQMGSKHAKQAAHHMPAAQLNSRFTGQVGQESNLQPAVLETQSGVSGGVVRHRQMPVCPTLAVVFCRRMSPCVVGHWGTYWGSRCFGGRSSPCSTYPIRGRTTPEVWPDPAAVPRRASAFSQCVQCIPWRRELSGLSASARPVVFHCILLACWR